MLWSLFRDFVFLSLCCVCAACLNTNLYFFWVYIDAVWVAAHHVCIVTLAILVWAFGVSIGSLVGEPAIVALHVTNDEMDPNLDFDNTAKCRCSETTIKVKLTERSKCHRQTLVFVIHRGSRVFSGLDSAGRIAVSKVGNVCNWAPKLDHVP